MNRARPEGVNPYPGPDDITRSELSNGLVVLTRPNFNSPSVVISGYLQVGGMQDPDDRLGLAHFTAAALMRGTVSYDMQALYDALESVGASMGFRGGTHTTGFSGKALSEDIDLLLALLVESLRNPHFPEDQVTRLKTQLLTGLALRAQDTGDMASMLFDEIVYAGHPYRRPEDGLSETVALISRDDLQEFHRSAYGPRGMVLAIVGAIDPDEVISKVQDTLGDWETPDQAVPPPLPPLESLKETVFRRHEIPGKSQADIILGVAGPPRSSEDYLPAALGNSVLGQFGMYGRIGQVIREQAGLAYYAYSSLSGGIGPGPWSVSAGVAPENVERAVTLIKEVIAGYVSAPVTDEELEDTKANFVGRLPLALESNSGVAGALINLERYELPRDYYRTYAERIRAYTPKDVLAASRRYLDPDRLAVAVAGTFGK